MAIRFDSSKSRIAFFMRWIFCMRRCMECSLISGTRYKCKYKCRWSWSLLSAILLCRLLFFHHAFGAHPPPFFLSWSSIICGPVHHPSTQMQFKKVYYISSYGYFLFTQYLLNVLHAIQFGGEWNLGYSFFPFRSNEMKRTNIRWMILFDRVLAFSSFSVLASQSFCHPLIESSLRFSIFFGLFLFLLSIRILNFNFVSLPEGCLKMNNERTVFEFKLISFRVWLFGWTAHIRKRANTRLVRCVYLCCNQIWNWEKNEYR